MALVDSLLTAIVRADGDALVMHVGEKPYVVASAGPIELSTQGLNLQAMTGMTAQLLPADAQRALSEFGAVEHELPARPEMQGDRFTVVVARGGDDVWIEIRRHRRARAAAPLSEPVAPHGVQAPITSEATAGIEPANEPVLPPVVAPVIEPDAAPTMATAPAFETPTIEVSPDVAPDAAAASLEQPPLETVAELRPVHASEPEPPPGPAPEIEPEPVVTSEVLQPVSCAPVQAPEIEVEPAPVVETHIAGTVAVETPTLDTSSVVTVAVETPAVETPAVETPAVETTTETTTVAPPAVAPPAVDTPAVEAPIPEPVYARDEPAPRPLIAAQTLSAPATTSATVIPMTRTLRIEVPPPATPRHVAASEIERLLSIAVARGATALYLTTQASPYVRVDADVRVLEGEAPLSSTDVESAVLELMPDTTRDALRRGEPTEWVSELAEIGPVRCSTFRDHRGPGAIFQLISMRPIAAAKLGLAPEVQALATETEGLVLVASPRANGKTTVLGSLVDLVNRRPAYVITLERQIRVVHEHHSALISQREVRGSKEELLTVARSALRENPDVLVVEELTSPEMFEFALDAAGSGVLVMASVTAASTAAALSRLVELCPPERRRALLSLVAERLRGVVAQVLLRRNGGGRVAAREVLLSTATVASVISDGQLGELRLAIESGRTHGMVSLTDALVHLIRTDAVDPREAYRKADDREALVNALKRENLETSGLERLA